jgi:predicted tellurium resistance membrane protein TerC
VFILRVFFVLFGIILIQTWAGFAWVIALALLWGCPQLCKAWKANHHPQKRPIPR